MDDSVTITIVVVVGFLGVFFLILFCVCLSTPHKIRRKKRRRKKFRQRVNDFRNEDVEYCGNEEAGNDLQMDCDYIGSNDDCKGEYDSGGRELVGGGYYGGGVE